MAAIRVDMAHDGESVRSVVSEDAVVSLTWTPMAVSCMQSRLVIQNLRSTHK
jgi:hypothetical protein